MTWETLYVIAGFVLALFYVPQIRVLLRDHTGLAAFSLRKAAVQLVARASMMPFVFLSIESNTILAMQGLDLALRTAEVAAAIWSRSSQKRTPPGLAPLVGVRSSPAQVEGEHDSWAKPS